jgi:hypothetical protein
MKIARKLDAHAVKMSVQNKMDTGAALGGAGLVVSIAGVIYSAINHKHIKSKCCGKEYDMSIDIGSTEEAKKTTEGATAAATGNDKTEIVTTSPSTKVAPLLSYKLQPFKPFPKLNLDY